jgi:hypothetical protein
MRKGAEHQCNSTVEEELFRLTVRLKCGRSVELERMVRFGGVGFEACDVNP